MSQFPSKHAGGDLPGEVPGSVSTPLTGTSDAVAVVPDDPAALPTLDVPGPAAVGSNPTELPTLGFLGQTTADPPETVHRRFGDYELLEEIARGGMGVVYKARQLRLHRLVALKMILGGQMATAHDVQRFRAEADEAASLDHPHIVPIYEVGDHDGQYYFTMKFMEGGTLGEHLARFTTDTRAAVRVLATVAYAVHHAHQHGILHRDLKPGNILLDADGQPHVTDFGLAKRIDGNSALTQTGAIVGTPSYMPPEQAGGKKTLTTAVDIYSLGAILFELLTGRPPFQAATPIDTALQVLQDEPPRPRQLNPRVPRDLETICLKCLEKDPQRRYGSADALARDLERWLTDEPIRARRSSVAERLVKWARRRPAGAALVGVLFLAGVGIVLGGIIHNVSLQAALAQAEKERLRAEENAVEARRHQAEAAANFQKARDAVDDMLTRVAEGRLANLSRMESVRLELLQEALKFYQGFLQEKSDDPIIRQETGRAHRRVADVCRIATRSQQSEAEYRQAIAIQETLATEFPDHGDYRHDLAITEANLAVLLKGLGRGPETQEHYRRAVALHERLVAEFPTVAEYRQRLAGNQNSLAQLLAAAKQVPEAEKLYRQALAVQLKLVADFPKVADHASDAAATQHNLAMLLLGRKQVAEARPHLEEAYRLQSEALRLKAGQPTYLTLLRSHYHELAKVLTQQGDHTGLEQLSARIRKDSPENPSDTYDAACYLSRAVPLLEKDIQIAETERHRRAQADADQAMALLQEAVKKGYRNSALAVKDSDLDALRGRAEFPKLLAEMDKRPAVEKSATAAQDYRTILKDYQDAEQVFLKALGEASTPEKQKEAFEKAPDVELYARRFLELAEANPQDEAAVDALNWVLENLPGPETNLLAARAVGHLTHDHVQDAKLRQSCVLLEKSSATATEALLRAVVEKNPYRQTQGLACGLLARRVKAKAENAQKQNHPTADALFKEADLLYERVNTQFADVKWNASLTAGQAIAADVYELRFLEVGKVAPEIEGEDLDGKPLKLSDYRGKVVVLDFWANWCGYCTAMYPQERELVKRHAGKTFVLLGINCDEDRAEIRKVVAEEQLNWQSWWDGGDAKQRIGHKWNVKAYPTVIVLDAKGVIRYKGVRGKAIDDAVDVLLKELGEAATPGK